MVEIVGVEARDASTLYSVLNAIVTIPLLYMIRLDGFGFSKFGTHGLLWTDAAANLLMFGVVAVVFLTCGLGLRRVSASQLTDEATTPWGILQLPTVIDHIKRGRAGDHTSEPHGLLANDEQPFPNAVR
jgi:hypothetical protein